MAKSVKSVLGTMVVVMISLMAGRGSRVAVADDGDCDTYENWYQCDSRAVAPGILGGTDCPYGCYGAGGGYLYECAYYGSCTGAVAVTRILSGYCGRWPVYGCGGLASCQCSPMVIIPPPRGYFPSIR